jgi:hypothetical protein
VAKQFKRNTGNPTPGAGNFPVPVAKQAPKPAPAPIPVPTPAMREATLKNHPALAPNGVSAPTEAVFFQPVKPAAFEEDIRPVSFKQADGTLVNTHNGDERYIDAYHSNTLAGRNKEGMLVAPESKGVSVVFNRQTGKQEFPTEEETFDYRGCVAGMCQDIAKSNRLDLEEFRKLNNAFGDSWEFGDKSFNQPVYSEGKQPGIDYGAVRVNDVVNMTRQKFLSDPARGIPERNQHIGRISKIVNGMPYVKHYVNGEEGRGKGRYYEEPLNDIKAVTRYTPTKIIRLDQFKDVDYANQDAPAAFNPAYKPNLQEKQTLATMNKQREQIQKTLNLTDKEYDELSRLSYGVMGAESDFGRSPKAFARMAVPNKLQELYKTVNGNFHPTVNSLSLGYGSNKESSQFTVGLNRKLEEGEKMNWKKINRDIRKGDTEDYNRNTSYTYHAMNKLGVNPGNMEDPTNSFKAVMSTLAHFKKLNPKATNEELLRRYNGGNGDKFKAYTNKVDRYVSAMGPDFDPRHNPTKTQEFWGDASAKANYLYGQAKAARSQALGAVRDASPLPDNFDQQLHDLLQGRETLTSKTFDKSTYKALEQVVREAVAENKQAIGYAEYKTTPGKNSDINGAALSVSKLTDGRYILKTTLGQAAIIPLGNNRYEVVDQYNFNDQGKSLGVKDDLHKRGSSFYVLARSLSRNYGSRPGDGSRSRIIVDLNPKK